MYKNCFYSTVKMNKSKILCVIIFFHFFIATIFYKGFGTELHDAISQEDKQAVQRLIAAKKIDINSKNNNQMTPLHLAVEKGNSEIVQLLLEAEAAVMTRSYYNYTPLCLAVKQGNSEIVQLLLKARAAVMTRNKYNETPLHYAATGKDVEIVKLLIKSGADVMARNKYKCTPLHLAAERGTIEIVKLLIASRADVMAQNQDNDTPLHYATQQMKYYARAVWAEDIEIMRLLIESGADVMAQNEYKSTPLHYAARYADVATIKLLIESGADVMARNEDEYTPLHYAVKRAGIEDNVDIDMISFLLASGADVKAVDNDGNTVLKLALDAILRSTESIWDDANKLSKLINIFIKLLLWSRYQTYADPLSNQQTDFFKMIRNLNLDVFNQNRALLNQAKNLVQWIMAELLKCESKEKFFQKIFDYLLNSYPEAEQSLLMQSIPDLILKGHQANLYPQERTLSKSQRKKLTVFKNLLRRTYAKRLKEEIFHHLSEEALEIKLNNLYTLKEISTAIQKYCQNTPIKSNFFKILLEKYQFNQTAAIRNLVVWSSTSKLSASEAHSKIFQQHFKNMKSLVQDLYMHLRYIIDQPPGSDRLDSDTQFGRGDNPQDILTFGE